MGYVYVAEAGKYCKIGIAEFSVDNRMKSVQTGCPVKIQRVWCSRNIPDHLACEKILHNHFRSKCSHGEWFEISFFEAAEYADQVCTIGSDKKRIEELEKENVYLKEQLKSQFSIDELAELINDLLKKRRNDLSIS